jgi:hypothetical protein
VPILDTADAIHRARNTGCLRGLHTEVEDSAGEVITIKN